MKACDQLMIKVKELRGSQDDSNSKTHSIEDIDERDRAQITHKQPQKSMINISLGSEDVPAIGFEVPQKIKWYKTNKEKREPVQVPKANIQKSKKVID